jgi:hypothetical protein
MGWGQGGVTRWQAVHGSVAVGGGERTRLDALVTGTSGDQTMGWDSQDKELELRSLMEKE